MLSGNLDPADRRQSATAHPRPLVEVRPGMVPAWSPDGLYLSSSTDHAGKLDIWIRDLRTGNDRQLSGLPS